MRFLQKTILIFFAVGFASCSDSAKNSDQKFFLALRALENGNKKEAERFFTEGKKSCGPYAAKKCAENLIHLGNMAERNRRANEFLKLYDDENSILIACRELFSNEEFSRVILVTEKIDLKNANAELVFLRLSALQKKNHPRYKEEFCECFFSRSIEGVLLNFFSSEEVKNFERENFFSDEQKKLFDFRILCAKKNWPESYAALSFVFDLFENAKFFSQLISDAGKSALYGAENFERDAYKFQSLAKKLEQLFSKEKSSDLMEAIYNANFYAGRLFAKTYNFFTAEKRAFIRAQEFSQSDFQSDNAAWYFLNSVLGNSASDAIYEFQNFAPRWKNPAYFDDLLDSLLILLLSAQDFEKIIFVQENFSNFFSKESCAKFSYVSARLIQERLAQKNKSDAERNQKIQKNFFLALDSGSDFYYKTMATARLNFSANEAQKAIFTQNKKMPSIQNTSSEDEMQKKFKQSVENTFLGYEIFGFPQKIFSEWILNRKIISANSALKAANFLQSCVDEKNNYKILGLKIASRTIFEFSDFFSEANSAPHIFSREDFCLAFPRFFQDLIENAAQKNSLPAYALYALVRSESFFDAKISSHAGAIGLTQLMKPTAADIAKKLKVLEYDLTDAQTNLDFGAFYLSELCRRLDNQKILAFFAYNAGITNARRWSKSIRNAYQKTGGPLYRTTGIAPDLFLEMVPFEETRLYGKKIATAAIIYALLYDDLSPAQVVNEIFN